MPPKKNLQQSSNKLGAVGAKKSQKLLGAKSNRAPVAGSSLSPSGSVKSTKKSNKSGKTPKKTNVLGSGRNIVQGPEPKIVTEAGNVSRQGSETKIGQEAPPSPTPSLVRGKKKKPEGTTTVESGASSKTSSKKHQKNSPPDLENPQPIGSFKQKLIKKLLRYDKPVAVHDVENPQGEAVPICNKKTLMISLILLILLILLIVLLGIFAGQGLGNGNTTSTATSITSMTTSMTTSVTTSMTSASPTGIPACNPIPFPGVSNATALGEYCKTCFVFNTTCVIDCCRKYYANGTNDAAVCDGICNT